MVIAGTGVFPAAAPLARLPDSASGARVGVPVGLAPKVTSLQNGTRWASEQGQLQVETFRIDTGATLDAVFDQQKKLPRRRVESSSMQGDNFVITNVGTVDPDALVVSHEVRLREHPGGRSARAE